MGGTRGIDRLAFARSAPALCAVALIVPAWLAGPQALVVALLGITVIALLWVSRLQRLIGAVEGHVRGAAGPGYVGTIEAGVAAITQQVRTLRHRLVEAHPVSGLPMREALLERIAADGAGQLGTIAIADFDRLSAFDPALADRVLATSVERLRAMLSRGRFLAQIDRGHVGVWFPADVSAADATAQLDAVAYALSETVVFGDSNVAPQVAVRVASLSAADEIAPGAFVTRALAAFAIPPATAAGPAAAAAPADGARASYALEQDLRLAIDRRELHLHFQPLIDAAQGCVGGAEALIRWDHPTRGPIPPAQFVPVLEQIGLAREIGTWALNAAVREAAVWSAHGLGRLRVAVNVSSLQLEGDDLPQLVQRTLQNHAVGAGQLEIELTESVATSDADHCREIFQALRALGVKLAVDDFGTGYSGFSSLRNLAFDKIKIDREFVTDVDTRGDSQAICQSIVALGRGLGIRVLAEGVERRAEYEWLRRHGCHHFQGYYFGQPMSGEAFLNCARDHAALQRLLATRIDAREIAERLNA